jgi:Na+/melibiose symporter-like transporter
MLANTRLRGGLISFFFQYLLQAGLFFTVPLFLSIALGLSAIQTGVRLLPLSLALLVAALGVPKFFPDISPRRVVRLGFSLLCVGSLALAAALEVGVGAEVVALPLLLSGLGIGALASQLGSVTVAAVPDEQSAEVGGLQNSVSFLGSSIGTALAGAVLISALTSSFLTGIKDDPAIPEQLSSQAQVTLAGGVPFIPDDALSKSLAEAGVDKEAAAAIVDENEEARLNGLRSALVVLALIALAALFLTGGIPTRQPAADSGSALIPPDD